MDYVYEFENSYTELAYMLNFGWSSSVVSSVNESNQGYGKRPYWDPLLHILIGALIPAGRHPTHPLIDATVPVGSSRLFNIRGYKPYTVPYSFSSDFSRYASKFHVFARVLGQAGNFRAPSRRSFLGEKGVIHVHPTGTGLSGSQNGPYLFIDSGVYYDLHGFNLPLFVGASLPLCKGSYGFCNQSIADNGSSSTPRFTIGSWNPVETHSPTHNFEEICDGLISFVNGGGLDGLYETENYNGTYYKKIVHYTNFNIVKGTFPKVTYDLRITYDLTPGKDWEANHSVALSTSPSSPAGGSSPPDVSINYPSMDINLTSSWVSWYRTGSSEDISWWPVTDYSRTWNVPVFIARPPTTSGHKHMLTSNKLMPKNVEDFFLNNGSIPSPFPRKRNSAYFHYCNSLIGDLRPSSLRSFSEAISHYEGELKSNNLELIADLVEGIRILPLVIKASSFWLFFRQGKILRAIDSALAFLASAHLLIEFGLKPTSSAVIETADALYKFQDKLSSSLSERTAYGTFTYLFPSEYFGGNATTLTTRTKARFGISESSLAATLMSSAALGVQPTLENFWEIIPFSFVADWFFNLGDRFNNIDTFIKSFAFDVKYCVHSYTIDCQVQDEDLAHFDIMSHESDPITLRYFKREVSWFPPSIRTSRFDFDAPTGTPSWSIVGSLLYTLK